MTEFALLRPELLPFTEEEIAAVCSMNPQRGFEALRLRTTAATLTGKTSAEQHEVVGGMLERHYGRTNPVDPRFCNEALLLARLFLADVRKFVPRKYTAECSSEGRIAFISDYCRLIEEWAKADETIRHGDNSRLARLREYEARRLIVLTDLGVQILAQGTTAANQDQALEITEHLESIFFTPDRMVEDVAITSWHNPATCDRLVHWHITGQTPTVDTDGLKSYQTILPCRTAILDGARELSFFELRGKLPLDAIRKCVAKDITNAELAISDRLGIRLVFFRRAAMEAAIKKVFLQVWPLTTTTWKTSDTMNGRVVGAARNGRSDANFQAFKCQMLVAGLWPEIIFQVVDGFLMHSIGSCESTHGSYRARQMLYDVLPKVMPKEIFEIDWTDPEIQRQVTAIAQASTME